MSNSYLAPRSPHPSPQRRLYPMPAMPLEAVATPVGADTDWTGLKECAQTLWRRKGTLLLITLLAVIAAMGLTLLEPRMYKSVAAVEIQEMNDNFLNLREVAPTAAPQPSTYDSYVQTQAEILTQDSVIERAIHALKLDQRPDFRPGTSYWDRLCAAVGLHVATLPPGRQAIGVVRKHLEIAPSRNSRIIHIAYEDRDPWLAANFANTLARTFIEASVDTRRQAARQIQEWLSPQLQELRGKLQQSEASLDAYTRETGLVFTPGQQNLEEEKLRSVQDELSKAQADRIAKEADYSMLASGQAQATSDSPVVREYDLKLTELRRQLADMESIMKPESYKVVRLKAQIAQLEAALQRESRNARQRIQDTYRTSQRRESTLVAAYTRQSRLVSNLSEKMTHYSTLKHEVDTNRQFYEAMLQKVNEAEVASAIRESNIQLVGPAEPARQPYKPNVPVNLAIGTFVGLAAAIGFVMLREQTNCHLRSPGESGACLNLPELGVIPKAENLRSVTQRLLGTGDRGHLVERITWERRFSGLSESFRAALASILSAGRNGDYPHVLIITSARPNEGKTTVVSNLGIALAEISRRVLLIDGDLRRPRLHQVFDQSNSWGLTEMLREKNAVDELPLEALVKKTGVPHLYLLPSGPSSESIFSLLYSDRMGRLMQRFRQEFDHVIVDAPPCLEFADARVLSRYAEGVVLVLRANYTDKKIAMAAAHRLLLDGIPLLGTILNDWDTTASDTYRYYSYGSNSM